VKTISLLENEDDENKEFDDVKDLLFPTTIDEDTLMNANLMNDLFKDT